MNKTWGNVQWADHGVNFMVVLISISLAFWLDGLRSDSEDRQIENRNLRGLLVDVAEDVALLDSLIIECNSIKRESDLVLENIDKYTVLSWFNKEDSVLLNHFFCPSPWEFSFSPSNITYESMRNAGRLDLISNFELRKSVINLNYKVYREEWEVNRNQERRLEDDENRMSEFYQATYPMVHFQNDKMEGILESKKVVANYQVNRFARIRSQCLKLIDELRSELSIDQ